MNLLLDIKNALMPETVITLLIIVCSILTFTLKKEKQGFIYYVSTYGVLLALFLFTQIPLFQEQNVLWNSFTSNTFTIIFRVLILVGTIITLQLSKKYVSGFGSSMGEFYTLLLIATLGAMLLAGANDLVMVFVALETLSISSFALTGYTKLDKLSNEAALKYLIIGAASAAVMLYGFSFVYGITGQTNLTDIADYLFNRPEVPMFQLTLAFLFILGGLSYKVAAVPFHMWAPDVYQGAPTPIAAFLSVVSKIAGFAALIRVLTTVWGEPSACIYALAIISLLTMTVGNLAALNQSNIKRLMAYSSIAQAGYIFLGLIAGNELGISSMIFYLIAYLFTNCGVWAAIIMHINHTGKDSIEAFNGLAYKQPVLAGGLTICLLSLAGIPITAGFFAKFYLFLALFFNFHIWLLILALINTLIAVYYYLRIIKAMFLKPQAELPESPVLPPSASLNMVLGFTVTAVILIGLFSNSLIQLSKAAAMKVYNVEITDFSYNAVNHQQEISK